MKNAAGQCCLHCVSVRAMSDAEKRGLQSVTAASDAAFHQFITIDAEL